MMYITRFQDFQRVETMSKMMSFVYMTCRALGGNFPKVEFLVTRTWSQKFPRKFYIVFSPVLQICYRASKMMYRNVFRVLVSSLYSLIS